MFVRADCRPWVLSHAEIPGHAVVVEAGVVAHVGRGAAAGQCMGLRGTTVVGKRAKLRVEGDGVGGDRHRRGTDQVVVADNRACADVAIRPGAMHGLPATIVLSRCNCISPTTAPSPSQTPEPGPRVISLAVTVLLRISASPVKYAALL